MDENPDVQSTDISPDDFLADEQEAKTDPSPVKQKDAPVAEPKEEAKAEPEAKETEDEAKPEEVVEETKEPQKDEKPEKPTKAEERKTELNTEIRDLVAKRNALKEEVTKINSEVYQPATEEELVDEGMTSTDAKVEVLRQQMEVRDYNERVAEAQLTIEHESNRILSDFAWADRDSTEYKEELSNEAAALLKANLITDPNTGQVIGSNISPYQLYKTLDRAAGISAVHGQIKGQEATEQMLANADEAASAAPPKKAVDPVLSLWEDPL